MASKNTFKNTFKKNCIYEVIIEIDNGVEKNFAPIGIKYIGTKGGSRKFEIFVFKGANMARLLQQHTSFTGIFSDDMDLFYECVTKNFSDKFKSKINKFPSAVFEVENIQESDNGFKVISAIKATKKNVEKEKDIRKNLINRAKYLTLESLIYYTKPITNDEKAKKIFEILRIVRKVAPYSVYERIISDLLLRINKIKEQ